VIRQFLARGEDGRDLSERGGGEADEKYKMDGICHGEARTGCDERFRPRGRVEELGEFRLR
jgi:hypothetical protein